MWWASILIGLVIGVFLLPPGVAAATQPVASSPGTPGQLAGMPLTPVGTLIAVMSERRTVVAAVPLAQGFRRGAVGTDTAAITTGGKPRGFAALRPGGRVHIEFRRIPTGDEAAAIEVLQEARG